MLRYELSREAYGSLGNGTTIDSFGPANQNRKENMIDHVILTVSDFKRSVAFYAKALKPLGITTLLDYEGKDGHPDLKGFGVGKSPFFLAQRRKARSSGRSPGICSERPF